MVSLSMDFEFDDEPWLRCVDGHYGLYGPFLRKRVIALCTKKSFLSSWEMLKEVEKKSGMSIASHVFRVGAQVFAVIFHQPSNIVLGCKKYFLGYGILYKKRKKTLSEIFCHYSCCLLCAAKFCFVWLQHCEDKTSAN